MLDALFLYGLDMLHVNVFTFLETMDLIIKKYNDEILLLEFSFFMNSVVQFMEYSVSPP